MSRRRARSVVLLGDPQQLAHVSQGTHPRGAGASVLEHLLGDAPTVPPDRGRVPRPDLAHAPRRLPLRLARRCTTAGCTSRRARAPARRLAGPVRARACGCSRSSTTATGRRAARRPSAIAGEVDRLLDGGRVTDRDGVDAGAHARRHPRRRAVQRAGPLPARARCPSARGSARSTSSRARRRPSCSSR